MKESGTSICPYCDTHYDIDSLVVGKVKRFSHLKANISVKFSIVYSCPECRKTLSISAVG